MSDQTWNEAIEAAAKVCDGLSDKHQISGNEEEMVAVDDAAEAVRALKREAEPPPRVSRLHREEDGG